MPEINAINWAAKIQEAENSAPVAFAPLEIGTRYNFEVLDATTTVSGAGNEYISYTARVVDGPRENAKIMYQSTHPAAKNISFFLEFYKSLGLGLEWLTSSSPSVEELAGAMEGRVFSAEVFVDKDARDDKNGDKYRSLRKYQPQVAQASAQPAGPAPSVASAPAPTEAWGNATKPAATETPWGNASGAPAAPWSN